MQKDTSVTYIDAPRKYKHIEVPEQYRTALQPTSPLTNAVWYAFFGSKSSDQKHDTVEERSKDPNTVYDAIQAPSANFVFRAADDSDSMVDTVSETYAGVFEIYHSKYAKQYEETEFTRPSDSNSNPLQQTTAYPDHFSYGWCVKCHGKKDESTRYILKKTETVAGEVGQSDTTVTLPNPTWFQDGTKLGAKFAGNCEAATLQDAPGADAGKLANVEGQTVVRRLAGVGDPVNADALEDMRKYMPAYHPHACRLHTDLEAA